MWVFKSNCLNTVSLSKKNNEEAQNQAMGIRHSSFFLFVNTVKKIRITMHSKIIIDFKR